MKRVLSCTFLRTALCLAFLLSLSVSPANPQKESSRCKGCERRAYMGEADSTGTGIVLWSSILSHLAETLTSPCFHLQRTDINVPEPEASRFASKARPPEYVFEAKYEENLNQRNADGSLVMNRLTINLFYDGTPREQVASWSVTSGINSFTACTNRMFHNDDAVMKKVRPVENLLADFEQRPVTCQIDTGNREALMPGEEIEITIKDFIDEKGRPSKYFNRVIVEVEQGDIIEGGIEIPSEQGGKRVVFRLDEVPIKFRYKAPTDEKIAADRVIVYSTCEILEDEKVPMEMTSKDRKIAEKSINLIRPDLRADFSSKVDYLMFEDSASRFEVNARISATYKLHSSWENKSLGEIVELYKMTSKNLESLHGQGKVFREETMADCKTTSEGSAITGKGEIKGCGETLRIFYDARSGQVKKVWLPDIGINFSIDGNVNVTEVCQNPPETHHHSYPFGLLLAIPPDQKINLSFVMNRPDFEKASGDLKSGTISGKGQANLGAWKITLSYRLQKKSIKQ